MLLYSCSLQENIMGRVLLSLRVLLLYYAAIGNDERVSCQLELTCLFSYGRIWGVTPTIIPYVETSCRDYSGLAA